jgi:hypothetical protein
LESTNNTLAEATSSLNEMSLRCKKRAEAGEAAAATTTTKAAAAASAAAAELSRVHSALTAERLAHKTSIDSAAAATDEHASLSAQATQLGSVLAALLFVVFFVAVPFFSIRKRVANTSQLIS